MPTLELGLNQLLHFQFFYLQNSIISSVFTEMSHLFALKKESDRMLLFKASHMC